MISIYTRTNNPLKIEFWKWLIKKILRKYSGPDAVLDSLKRGLAELEIPFEINPFKPKYKIIHILSGINTLKKRIREKKDNQILIAGPNIVTLPLDNKKIISNNKIDLILTPSDWVRDFYISQLPEIKNKIFSWPAGVKIPKISSDKSGKIIIIQKEISQKIYDEIKYKMTNMKINFEVLKYGTFSRREYIKKLEKTPLLIYLQSSESQGLALQEAWSYNVPTLIYQNNEWRNNKYSWTDPKISAPYISEENGLLFTLDNFEEKLNEIFKKNVSPQNYCRNNLSDTVSIRKLFDIIKIINEETN